MDRAAVIVVKHGHLLLIERVRRGRTYHLFPGGGVEDGPRDTFSPKPSVESSGVAMDLKWTPPQNLKAAATAP